MPEEKEVKEKKTTGSKESPASDVKVKNLNIHQKILKIADAAGILQRTKAGFNYKYVPEEEIQAKVTGAMQEYGVMLYNQISPGTLNVLPYTYTKLDKKTKENVAINEVIVSADTVYTWVNADNPAEKIEVPWAIVGQMEDASQAFGAANTYCNRYFLMKSLQLATTEADPDDYRSKQQESAEHEKNKEEQKTKDAIDELVNICKKAIESGIAKEETLKIIAKHNEGNQNPRNIKSTDVCVKIAQEIAFLKPIKKENKEDSQETNKETK